MPEPESPSRPGKPYKFLDAYGLSDADIFFGRERETRVLLSDVIVNRLVVLFAPSGTGKTSLINAGVRPRLQQRDYATFFIRVSEDPVVSARQELQHDSRLALAETASFGSQLEKAVEQLGRPLVLFFDQFEEFFIYVLRPKPDAGRAFIEEIGRVYRNRDSGVHFVFSMREEFFVEMEAFRDEIPTKFHKESNLRLRRLDRDQARDAIVQPARVFETECEPALVERLLADLADPVADDPTMPSIEPTQLQIVCDTLWETREQGRMKLRRYLELGREAGRNIARQVLYDRIEEGFQALTSPEQFTLLARLLPELRTDEGTKYVRDVASLVKALSTGEAPAAEPDVRALLELLARVRFIKHGRRDKLEVVELSHDYLVGQLDELARRVRLIWPRRKLAEALRRQEATELATIEQLEAIASSASALVTSAEQAWFLFRSALAHGYIPEVWFRLAAGLGADVWRWLEELVADPGEPIARLSYVIDLCERVLRAGDVVYADRAFGVLENALGRDDLTMEAQEALAKLSGIRPANVAAAATDRLLNFLGGALETGRIASSSVAALGRIERVQSVDLLKLALDREDLAQEAQTALGVLTGAQGAKLATLAADTLCDVLQRHLEGHGRVFAAPLQSLARVQTRRSVELLVKALERDDLAATAKLTLERLAGSSVHDVQTAARAALSIGYRRGTAPASEAPRQLDVREFGEAERHRRGVPHSGAGESLIAAIGTQVEASNCLLLVGAGVHAPPPAESASWYPEEQRPPLRMELSKMLAEQSHFEALYPGESPLNFDRVVEHYEYTRGRTDLLEILRKALQLGKRPSPILRAIARLPFPIILSTNYDGLLEQALIEGGKSPIVFILHRDEPSTESVKSVESVKPAPDQPLVIKLYGDLGSPGHDVVITDDDFIDYIRRINSRPSPLPDIVRAKLRRHPLLILGLWLGDYRARSLLRSFDTQQTDTVLGYPFYALDPYANPAMTARIESRYQGKLVPEDIWSFIPQLLKRVVGEDFPPSAKPPTSAVL